MSIKKICIPVRLTPQSIGGPASFVRKLTKGLHIRGIETTYDLDDLPYDAVLVIFATRHLGKLRRARKQGIRIVQRLGGVNWQHRFLPVGLKGFVLAEIRNYLMRFIRNNLADHIVYQSDFVKQWWENKYGLSLNSNSIIYNGVNLEKFSPYGNKYKSTSELCLISVEGRQGNNLDDPAIDVGSSLVKDGVNVDLLVFGMPWKDVEKRFAGSFINFKGHIPNDELPFYYRGAQIFISNDIIAACPNSVIEALACGVPVLGYKMGVLPELITEDAGCCVPGEGDPWKGEAPENIGGLSVAAKKIMENWPDFSQGARRLAQERYGLEEMIHKYLNVLYR